MKTITFDETLWQLVPKEPTDEMLAVSNSGWPEWRKWIWKAMIESAPPPPSGDAGKEGW